MSLIGKDTWCHWLFIIACVSCLILGVVCSNAHQSNRPHIVFVLADDLGWDDVGFHGSQQIPTPNLDTLAYDGIILGNYYVQPLCTPSRAALLTGRYPIHLGLQHDVLMSAQPYGLPLNETILPQYLKPLGYRSHIVGKWHLGFVEKDYLPTHRGFESHYGYYQGCGGYYDHTYVGTWPNDHKSWGFDFNKNEAVERPVFGEYSTELFTRQAESIIAEHNTSEPLFLYLAHQAVHSGNPDLPLTAPLKYMRRVSHIKSKTRRTFAAMASALDDSVGNVTRALHLRGMLHNTIIIFSTDNGGPAHGFNRNDASNFPLRGLKYTLWEGGVRGTGFIWSPLLRKSGYTSHRLMHIADWLPTLLHAADAANTTDPYQLPREIDGVDQWNVLSDDSVAVRREVLLNIDPYEKSKSLRVGDMKLVSDKSGYTRHCAGWYSTDENTLLSASGPCDEGFDGEDAVRLIDDDKIEAEGVSEESVVEEDWLQLHRGDFVPFENADHEENTILTPDRAIQNRQNEDFSGDRISQLVHRQLQSDVQEILRSIGRNSKRSATGPPLIVKCGSRPSNASTNCQPWLRPCLFNVTADPCEFENIAAKWPSIVDDLEKRLDFYERSARTPLNTRVDDAGLPYHHDWTWVPWIHRADRMDLKVVSINDETEHREQL